MFDNIIQQGAAAQLGEDIISGRLAPSMLFFGPPASGKGSTALEFARVLSCESLVNRPRQAGTRAVKPKDLAPWTCPCPSCIRHRALLHGDLAILGPRPFAAEIAASHAAYQREPSVPATGTLFIRSLRKLMARFAPAIWEYENRAGKLNPLAVLESLENDIAEFEMLNNSGSGAAENSGALEKLCDSLLKNAFRLSDEGMGDTIPIAQIRRAAYWSRLAPSGQRKTLLVENADRMRDEAKNSLLKLLEEPPETVSIILTVQRRELILPTILSRLRPYRFLRRAAEEEREIIRRVFRGLAAARTDGPGMETGESGGQAGLISAYLDSFLPQSTGKLYPLAAFFVASTARASVLLLKKKGRATIPAGLAALGSYSGPIAEAAGYGRAAAAKEVFAALLPESGNFEGGSFSRFIANILEIVSQSQRRSQDNPRWIAYNELWRRHAARAEAAAGVWNQNPALALEALFCRLKTEMAELG
ncbi:MAG: DNA polymerase III [Treponema sp.]|nr:DNA polymerase III [Treponema sp.]